MVALITNGLNRMRTLRSFSYTPRWIVFLIDVALAIMAVSVAYLIWVNFQIDRMRLDFVLTGALVIVGIRVISFLLGHTYSGIVRFTGTEDALRIYYVLTAGRLPFFWVVACFSCCMIIFLYRFPFYSRSTFF